LFSAPQPFTFGELALVVEEVEVEQLHSFLLVLVLVVLVLVVVLVVFCSFFPPFIFLDYRK